MFERLHGVSGLFLSHARHIKARDARLPQASVETRYNLSFSALILGHKSITRAFITKCRRRSFLHKLLLYQFWPRLMTEHFCVWLRFS